MKFAGVIEPGVASGIVSLAKYIAGSYVVVENIAERDAIKAGVLVNGTPVFVASTKEVYRCTKVSDTEYSWEKEETNSGEFGYYNKKNRQFYRDPEFTELIIPNANKLYIDKNEDEPFYYKVDDEGSRYVSLKTNLTEIDNRLTLVESKVATIEEQIADLYATKADDFDEIIGGNAQGIN